jgi:hypothetical protein
VLADKGSLLTIYKPYLERFLENDKGDFKIKPLSKTAIAQSSAEMVRCAVLSFSTLECPRYYQDFLAALDGTITKIARFTEFDKEAERILGRLIV